MDRTRFPGYPCRAHVLRQFGDPNHSCRGSPGTAREIAQEVHSLYSECPRPPDHSDRDGATDPDRHRACRHVDQFD